MVTDRDVSKFVSEHWAGVYVTHKYGTARSPQNREGCQLWLTLLHGPHGPKVFTLERPDGTLEDVTRDYRGT